MTRSRAEAATLFLPLSASLREQIFFAQRRRGAEKCAVAQAAFLQTREHDSRFLGKHFGINMLVYFTPSFISAMFVKFGAPRLAEVRG